MKLYKELETQFSSQWVEAKLLVLAGVHSPQRGKMSGPEIRIKGIKRFLRPNLVQYDQNI